MEVNDYPPQKNRCMHNIWLQRPYPIRGGGVLAYKGLMGMCHWMGSLFHYCIGYNIMGLHFLIIELLE